MIRWYLPVTAIKGDYNLEAYTSFAQVYDLFMDNVPYEEWSRYIIGLLKIEDAAHAKKMLAGTAGCWVGVGSAVRVSGRSGSGWHLRHLLYHLFDPNS